MASKRAWNLVKFVPDGGAASAIPLTLEQPWTMSAGLKPDVNQARVRYADFNSLGTTLPGGSIQFFYNSDSSPDVTLSGVIIVHVEAGPLFQIPGTGNPTYQPADYKVFFADSRFQYVEPRGGRLKIGVINPGVKPSDDGSSSDAPAPPGVEMSLSEMISACLAAMSVTNANVPDSVDDTDAPRDVQWLGNHAPTELEKLLELANCVFVPDFASVGHVELKSADGSPKLPADDAMPEMQAPRSDLRGGTVVVAGYPSRNKITQTITGPSSTGWQFVAQETDGTWQPVDSVSWINGSALVAWREQFANVDPKWQARARQQVFRFIQLVDPSSGGGGNSTAIPTGVSPILPCLYEDTSGVVKPPLVTAKAAFQDPSTGQFSNAADPLTFDVQNVIAPNVLQLAGPVFQVAKDTFDPYGDVQLMSPGDMSVRFSQEDADQDDQGNWTPAYYEGAFQRSAGDDGSDGGVIQLEDDDAANAADSSDPDTTVISRPDLWLLTVDGEVTNQDDCDNSAQAIATPYLSDSKPTRIASCRGFAAVAPSGVCGKVEWHQEELLTRCTLNDWGASTASTPTPPDIAKAQAGPAHPQQTQTQTSRIALGAAGASLPVVPVTPGGAQSFGGAQMYVFPTGNGSVGGIYSGVIWTPTLPDTSNSYESYDFSSAGNGTAVTIINPLENNLTLHTLPVNKFPVPAWPAPSGNITGGNPDAKMNVFVFWDPTAIRSVRWNSTAKSLQYAFYTDAADSDYHTIVTFVPQCS